MALMTRDLPSQTTYCMSHERLEAIDEVTHAAVFRVYERAVRTERMANEVRAITKTGCKVRFIGGPSWKV